MSERNHELTQGEHCPKNVAGTREVGSDALSSRLARWPDVEPPRLDPAEVHDALYPCCRGRSAACNARVSARPTEPAAPRASALHMST